MAVHKKYGKSKTCSGRRESTAHKNKLKKPNYSIDKDLLQGVKKCLSSNQKDGDPENEKETEQDSLTNTSLRDDATSSTSLICVLGMPIHKLNLKIGAVIMLLRNLNIKRGLCNGTRLIVKELKPNLIIAEVLTGSAAREIVFIPRICLAHTDTDLPFV